MAIKGQRFNLNLDADNFEFDVHDDALERPSETFDVVKEIRERDPAAPPAPPKLRSKSGFPEHRPRRVISSFKQRQQQNRESHQAQSPIVGGNAEPSDRAIAHHIGQKYGFDTEAKEKARISEENRKRLAEMSLEDIEAARAELMSGMNPVLLQRLLNRANIDEDQTSQKWEKDTEESENASKVSQGAAQNDIVEQTVSKSAGSDVDLNSNSVQGAKKVQFQSSPEVVGRSDHTEQPKETSMLDNVQNPESLQFASTTHFPVPPRDASDFKELDPDSETFLDDLRARYFPDTPHDPNALSWLQDPTDEDIKTSPYASTQHAYAPSDIRFDFNGRLIPPSESETIAVDKGLHHHGEAPSSAGYTIPELALLCRSTLPNQRCIAYQTLGRILYRLGRGDFGPKGTELHEGLWACVEHERPIEVMMTEANRTGGHMSAKTYATEALWLWRRGGGGDRGVLKEGQRIVR